MREAVIKEGITYIEQHYGYARGRLNESEVIQTPKYAAMLLDYLEGVEPTPEIQGIINEVTQLLRQHKQGLV